MRNQIVLCLSVVFLLTTPLFAQTVHYIFVGLSIQDTINTAGSGDTIKVAPGTYTDQLTLTKVIHLVGAASVPDSVKILTASTSVTYNSGSQGSSIRGFTITSSGGNGVAVNYGPVTIYNNVVTGCTSTSVSGIKIVRGSVINNTIQSNTNGVDAADSSSVVVAMNTIKNNTNAGILNLRGVAVGDSVMNNGNGSGNDDAGIIAEEGAYVAGNYVSSNNGYGIWITNANNIWIIANVTASNTLDGIYADYNLATFWRIQNNVIRNNTRYGFQWRDDQAAEVTVKTVIGNNVIYGNGSDGIYLFDNWQFAPLLGDVTIQNNIVANNGGFGINRHNNFYASDANLLYNDFYNNTAGSYGNSIVAGTGDISSDPMFTNAASADFSLQGGSPCINAGLPNLSQNDIDKTRNDMGVYGGAYPWTNYFNNPAAVRVLSLELSTRSVLQGSTITITTKGATK